MSGRDPDSGDNSGGGGGGGGPPDDGQGPPDDAGPPGGSPPGAPRDIEALKRIFGEGYVDAKRVVDGLPGDDDDDGGDDTPETPSIRQQLHQHPDVHSVGIGRKEINGETTSTISIVVYVREKLPEEDLEDDLILPDSIDGVDIDVKESSEWSVESVDPPLQESPSDARTDDSHEGDQHVRYHTHRPVFGGVSGGHVDVTAGTIAAPFEDSGGNLVWLTNRHITAEGTEHTLGEDFCQPGPDDNSNLHVVGTVQEQGAWDADGTNYTDSGIVSPNDTSDVADHVLGLGSPGASELANFNDTYVKSGRTTNIKSSLLKDRDVSTTIDYGGTSIYYEGLITFEPVSEGGDSGSIWARYNRNQDAYHPIGLHFAGSVDKTDPDARALAIPFEAVESEHGTLSPPTTNIDPDFGAITEGLPLVETAPLAFETDSRGQLPLLVCHTGVGDSETEREIRIRDGESDTAEIVYTYTDTDFSEGEHHVADLDLAREIPDPDPRLRILTIDPDHTSSQTYEIYLNEQTEWEFDVTVQDADQGTLVQGADVLIEEWDENPPAGEEQIGAQVFSGTTDSEGHVRAWLEPRDYRLTVDHPDFLSDASTQTIETQSNSATVDLLTAQNSLSTHWDSPNGNPYSIKYPNYVGPQPIGIAFEERDFPARPRRSSAHHICSSVSELETAINNVAEGEMIWLEAGETFNVDDLGRRIRLPQNATIASDGARVLVTSPRSGIFYFDQPGIRMSGIRLEGDHIGYIDDDQTSTGLFLRAQDLRVDNCEFYGWRSSAIFVGWNEDSPAEHVEPHIHHCISRDNYQTGLGYGTVVYSGDPLIEYCFYQNCRHGIAAGGGAAQSYRAHNNLMGDTFGIWPMECHSPGGVRMSIQNNEYHLTDNSSFVQRGAPSDQTTWDNNWTFNTTQPDPNTANTSGAALRQYDHGSTGWVNVSWSNNAYGSTEPSDSSIGIRAITRTEETTGAPPPSGPIGRRSLSWSSTTDWDVATEVEGIVADEDLSARIGAGDFRQGYSLDSRAHSPLENANAYWPLAVTGLEHIGDRPSTHLDVEFQRAGAISTKGAYFNGATSDIRTPTDSDLRTTGSFTVHAVINKTGTKNLQTILRNGYNEPGIIFLALRDNDGISFGFYDSNGDVQYSDTFHTGSVVPGEWNHIAATYDGDATLRVRLNGNSETISVTGSRPTPPTGSDNDYFIGQRGHPSGDDRYFEGYISHVALFENALSTDELDRLWAPMSSGRILDTTRSP